MLQKYLHRLPMMGLTLNYIWSILKIFHKAFLKDISSSAGSKRKTHWHQSWNIFTDSFIFWLKLSHHTCYRSCWWFFVFFFYYNSHRAAAAAAIIIITIIVLIIIMKTTQQEKLINAEKDWKIETWRALCFQLPLKSFTTNIVKLDAPPSPDLSDW